MHSVRRPLLLSFLLVSSASLLSCGGSQQTSNISPAVPRPELSVFISPTVAELDTTLHSPNTVQFTASVSNSADTRINWKVNNRLGGDSDVGTISSSGLYTAPLFVAAAPITISAVSVADPSKSAFATVTLRWAVELSLETPGGTAVPLNGGIPIKYSVDTNAPEKGVDWSVNWVQGGDTEHGTIHAEGPTQAWYNAPAKMPSAAVRVRAVARANSSKNATIGLTFLSANFVVLPMAATLAGGQQAQFKAYLNGTEVPANWILEGIGTMQDGVYTAPADLTTTRHASLTARYEDRFATSVVTVTPEGIGTSACMTGTYVLAFHTSSGPTAEHFLGTISSDGKGHLIGIGDLFAPGYIDEPAYDQVHNQAFSGTYSCNRDGGAVLNVTLPIRKPFPVEELSMHATFAQDGSAYVFVQGNAQGTGVMERQVNVPYSKETMAGTFVFSLDGGFSYRCLGFCLPSGYPITMLGLLEAESSGTITGSIDYVAPTSQQARLDGSSFMIDRSGRGIATLQFGRNNSNLFCETFSIVAASPDKWFYMSWSLAGPEPFVLQGSAERQASLDALSLQGAFVFQVGARTGRFIGETGSGILTGTVDEVVDDVVKEDLPFSSALTVERNGRSTGDFNTTDEQPADLVSYFIRPGKWLLAIGPSLGEAELQSNIPFTCDLFQGAYAFQYKGAEGWFTRQPPDDGFGWIASGPALRYLRTSFPSVSQEGKGIFEFEEATPEGLSLHKVKFYAISDSKLLFTDLKGFAERTH